MDSSHNTFSLEDLMPLIREQLAMGQNVRIYPNGTSMMPMIRQKIDSVILSPLPQTLQKFDLPLYQRKNGQYVLHRIVKAEKTYTCVGDNQFDLEIGLEHSQMIAVVTGFYRGDKLYPVTHLGYRFYCQFWHLSRPMRKIWRRGKSFLRRLLK